MSKKDGLEERFEAMISPVAAQFETKPEHWINGWDESFSYCYECAEKKVEELEELHPEENQEFLIDGGWSTEGDSQAFCESCGCALDNCYTIYCCEAELDHFEENGFDPASPDDCHSFSEILLSQGWSERTRKLAQKILDRELKQKEEL